jgi:hypothetical protein
VSMATTSTPAWAAAQAGVLGSAGATAASAQINQLLGTHADSVVYQGSSVVAQNGSGYTAWQLQSSTLDIDQPFTMSGTTIGRVVLPLLAVGAGADLLVSLCADNGSGLPGAMVRQTRIPASWIYQLSAVAGVAGPSGSTPTTVYTGNALAVAQFNALSCQFGTEALWAYPAPTGGSVATSPTAAYYGNYMIQIGGSLGGAAVANAFTMAYNTTGILSQAVPQSAFPTTTDGTGKATVALDASTGSPTIVVTGGSTTYLGSSGSAVYAATFDDTTGTIGSWSATGSPPPTATYTWSAACPAAR